MSTAKAVAYLGYYSYLSGKLSITKFRWMHTLRLGPLARYTGREWANRGFGVSALHSIASLITIERLAALHVSALHSTVSSDALLLPTNPPQDDASAASETNRFSTERPATPTRYNLLRPFATRGHYWMASQFIASLPNLSQCQRGPVRSDGVGD